MKKFRNLLIVSLPAIGLLIAGAGRSPAPRMLAGPGFAVVELFTSEGCSSCPPADETLSRIAAEYKDNVYVLGFHVDYWDKLGWKDIYSNADYTQRQQQYARVFRLSSIYTPQAVVNGEKELVGSDEKTLRADIDADLKRPGGKKIVLKTESDSTKIKIGYQVADRSGDLLYIALVQSHAESRVGGGENSGRRLQHINVVRDLKEVAGSSGSVEFSIPQGLHAADCRVIAFLQKGKAGDLSLTGAAGAELQ